jgi:hypothetical protein
MHLCILIALIDVAVATCLLLPIAAQRQDKPILPSWDKLGASSTKQHRLNVKTRTA